MSNILIQHNPIHVEFMAGGEVKSKGIAFGDYERMQSYWHKLAPNRRYDVPTWAVNDDQTCAVIARSMEGRAGLRVRGTTTDRERLQKAQQILQSKEPQLVARLDGICKRFVEAKKNDDNKFAEQLGIQAAAIDTQLRLLDRTAEVLGGVVYFYWRVGFTSFQVADQLGIKPTHVRQLTYRLIETGIELGYGAPLPISRRPSKEAVRALRVAANESQRAEIIRLHKEGKFTVEIARELGLGKTGSEIVNNVLIQAGLR